MNKKERQNLILQIIETHEVERQEELVNLINERGAKATQATISRDICELNLVKVAGKEKRYKYQKVISGSVSVNKRNLTFFKESVVSIEEAGNLIVIKTLSGNANAVATVVDGLNFDNILGSVAGDDTLLVITKTVKDAHFILQRMRDLVKKDA